VLVQAIFFCNEQFNDVKLMQAYYTLLQIEKFCNEYGVLHTIFCGDLNSMPDSAVYEYITTGKISEETAKKTLFPKFAFTHDLSLLSAYSVIKNPKTNFSTNFSGCLDYIFFNPNKFECTEILDSIDIKHTLLQPHKVLPNPYVPSDHVCLMASLALKK